MHPEFAPISLIAAVLVLIPLPWHWRTGNVATLSMAFWLFVVNVILGIDAIIWRGNVKIVAPVWCDITSKIIIGANFALPAACLCIGIHLERMSALSNGGASFDKRRRQIFEAVACFVAPVFFMGLHYVVQGHRFDIIEDYGCRPTTYVSIPAIFIIWIPPLVMSFATLVFAVLALRHFNQHRINFAMYLQSAMSTSRYFRLMAMAVVMMIWSTIITSYALWFSVTAVTLRPWRSWNYVHSDFWRIDRYLNVSTPPAVITAFYILWWAAPSSSVLFFAFFAFGKEPLHHYKACFRVLKKAALDMTTGLALKDGGGKFSAIIDRFSLNSSKASSDVLSGSTNTPSFVFSTVPGYRFASRPKSRTEPEELKSDSNSFVSAISLSQFADSKVRHESSSLNPPSTPSIAVAPPLRPSPALTRMHMVQHRSQLRPLTYPFFDPRHQEFVNHFP